MITLVLSRKKEELDLYFGNDRIIIKNVERFNGDILRGITLSKILLVGLNIDELDKHILNSLMPCLVMSSELYPEGQVEEVKNGKLYWTMQQQKYNRKINERS